MSNAWVIYLRVGNNTGKLVLIPHDIVGSSESDDQSRGPQGLALGEEPASD